MNITVDVNTCKSCGFADIWINGVSIVTIAASDNGNISLIICTFDNDSIECAQLKKSGVKTKRAKGQSSNYCTIHYAEKMGGVMYVTVTQDDIIHGRRGLDVLKNNCWSEELGNEK